MCASYEPGWTANVVVVAVVVVAKALDPVGSLKGHKRMLDPQAETAAAHAAQRGLPRIVAANATSHPPPSLNNYRTAAARAPANSAPALWYWQLTGEEWLRDSHSYELAAKAWRRMPAEHKAAERERVSCLAAAGTRRSLRERGVESREKRGRDSDRKPHAI